MIEYKKLSELKKLDNYALIAYKKKLSAKALALQKDIREFGVAWVDIKKLVADRVEDIQYEIIEIEDRRLAGLADGNYLDLQ